jgi:transposase
MRPPGSQQQLEGRRRRAIQPLYQGLSLSAVVRKVGCSVSSVSLWRDLYSKKGVQGLAAKLVPGRRPNLTTHQKITLVKLLVKGPMAHGYATELWTTRRVAEVIERRFRVRYHPTHIWRLLVGLGWSCQTPERRARERDEAAIEQWKRNRRPHIKNASGRGAHLVFADESGFSLIPSICRTWAPRGATPTLQIAGCWTKLSAISALSVSPKRGRLSLCLHFQPTNITALAVCGFLKHLLRHLRGPIVLLWDSTPVHKAGPIGQFRASHPRLHVERFPGYAPELNPDEFVWTQLKRSLCNAIPKDLAHLRRLLLRAPVLNLRRSQRLLWSCSLASDLPW